MKLHETLTRENWCKGSPLHWSKGKLCLIGHLGPHRSDATWQRVREAIGVLFPERCTRLGVKPYSAVYISAFNDHQETTLEDVRRVLKLADV